MQIILYIYSKFETDFLKDNEKKEPLARNIDQHGWVGGRVVEGNGGN